jgi:hypothetical protein
MSAWITDRVPTHKDGDTSGMVWTTEDGVVARSYTNSVRLGTPWQPITYPEPYVKEPVWSWKRVDMYGTIAYAVRSNGLTRFHADTRTVTQTEIQAMTDALNRLEEIHD